jgi:hypothetical protein
MKQQSKMKVYPFGDVCRQAAKYMRDPHARVHQQFNCAGCGVKQTMSDPNHFFDTGRCEECGHVTNIRHRGCNYMVMFDLSGKGLPDGKAEA